VEPLLDRVDRERPSRRALCSDVSREHAEPLAATASYIEHWILVEYRRLWSSDTIGGSGLPDEAKAHLRSQLAALPRSRLLFIRRPERRGRDGLAVFYGRSAEQERPFYGLEISGYDELPGLDFAGALAGGPPLGEPLTHPLLVVCTHGKRDRCCAKYGRPLYEELREEADAEWVWQSTHVGGDRFAGNLVCLPEGLYFGRVQRPDVWSLLDEYLAGRIELDHYRGRSCYPFAVQAAERRVREETGLAGVDDLVLESCTREAESAWSVRFRVAESGAVHELEVAAERAQDATYLTCSAPTPQRPRRFQATAHRVPAR
jgi:hypothetical protein